jgi:hypothetical protein
MAAKGLQGLIAEDEGADRTLGTHAADNWVVDVAEFILLARCSVIASLITVYSCWEFDVAVPSGIQRILGIQRPDGSIAFDFNSYSDVEICKTATSLSKTRLLQLNSDERKRIAKELPKEAALGIVKMWEIIGSKSLSSAADDTGIKADESAAVESSLTSHPTVVAVFDFISFIESTCTSTFRLIAKKMDKKREKAILSSTRDALIAALYPETRPCRVTDIHCAQVQPIDRHIRVDTDLASVSVDLTPSPRLLRIVMTLLLMDLTKGIVEIPLFTIKQYDKTSRARSVYRWIEIISKVNLKGLSNAISLISCSPFCSHI